MKISIVILLLFTTLVSFSQKDTLKVAVYDKAPFGSELHNGDFEGLMIDLWENIASDLNLQYQYELVDMETLVNGLHQGEFNIGLGAISVTPERERLIDFTHAVNPSGTTIAMASNKNKMSFYEKIGPIAKLMGILFLSLILILLIAATTVWSIERKNILEIDEGKTIKKWKDGLLWSTMTMTTIGNNDNLPMSRIGKAIGFLWMFTSIIFISLFTANASAKFIKADNDYNKFTTLDDLQNAKVVAVANSSGEAYLKRNKINYEVVPTLEEALEKIVNGNDEVIVYNAPVLNYYNNILMVNQLDVIDNYLLKNNMAIALEPDSPYKEKINISLLEYINTPKWQQKLYNNIGNRKEKELNY